jgi:hypothetical protein
MNQYGEAMTDAAHILAVDDVEREALAVAALNASSPLSPLLSFSKIAPPESERCVVEGFRRRHGRVDPSSAKLLAQRLA